MAKLDIDWLGVFVEIYKSQSVSRAALALGIEQASASIALNKLRRHFSDPLFCRTSQGMSPTPRAHAIYPDVQEALQRIAAARGAPPTFSPQDTRRVFRICITDISEVILLPRLIKRLHADAPGLVLEAHKISPGSRTRLESGDADLAIGFIPDLEGGFYQQALFSQDFVCLAARDHPRIQGKISRKAFANEAHIAITASGTGHSIVDKIVAKHHVERRAVLRVPSFLGVARIVAESEFLVIVPRRLGEALASQEKVQVLEPPLPLPSYKVKQHWHERFNADPGNIWLRRTMMELFSDQAMA